MDEKEAIEYLMLMHDKLDFNKQGFVYGSEAIATVLNNFEKYKASYNTFKKND